MPQCLHRSELSIRPQPISAAFDAGLAFGIRTLLTDPFSHAVAQPAPPAGWAALVARPHSGGASHHRSTGERRQRRGHHGR